MRSATRLELKKPVILGCSMGGNVCLSLALRYEHEFLALIALEACDYSPGWWINPLHHPHIHGGEVVATSVFGLMSPESPDEYRWETWWYYAQGGPGVFKGDLYFYSVDSDYRDQVSKISGKLPMFFLTGEYDFACTPEMTERTAEKIKNAECIIFSGGHFPTSEDPVKFKEVISPVLKKVLALDPERRRERSGAFTTRSSLSSARAERPAANADGRRHHRTLIRGDGTRHDGIQGHAKHLSPDSDSAACHPGEHRSDSRAEPRFALGVRQRDHRRGAADPRHLCADGGCDRGPRHRRPRRRAAAGLHQRLDRYPERSRIS